MSPLRSSAGPAVWTNGDVELGGDDLRERGLAEARAGRPAARGRARSPRAAAASIETASCSLHAPPGRRSRPAGAGAASGRARPPARTSGVWIAVGDPGVRIVSAARPLQRVRRSGPRACRPAAPSSSCVGLLAARSRARAGPSRASARGSSPRGDARSAPSSGARADLLAQLDDDPLGRALADPGDGLEARACRRRRRAPSSSRGGAAGEHGERHLRADALDAEQQQEEVALLLGGEAVERQRVVAHDQVRVQRDRLADAPGRGAASRPRRRAGSRRRRTSTTTWSARRHRDLAARRARSSRPPSRSARAARSGARLAWQIATASASAAWSGSGSSGSESSACTMRWTCVLVGAAGAADRALDLLRRVGAAAGMPRWPAASSTTPRAWPTANARARVGAEVEVLDRDGVGRVLGDQLADARVDRGQAALQRQPRAASRSRRRRARPDARRRCATTP